MNASLTPPITANSVAVAAPANNDRQKVVSVTTGNATFGINSSLIDSVLQFESVDNEERNSLQISGQTVPVLSLNQLLIDEFSCRQTFDTPERALLVLKNNDVVIGLQTTRVSRPLEIDGDKFFQLPAALYADGRNRLLDSIVVLDEPANDKIQFIINPINSLLDLLPSNPHMRPAGFNQANTDNDISRARGQMVKFTPQGCEDSMGLQFCLPLASVAEVIRGEKELVVSLPTTAQGLEGFLMWRGIPVPLLNLALCFGVQENESPEPVIDQRLMVCRVSQQQHVAFYTRSQIRTLPTPEIHATEHTLMGNSPALAAFETPDGLLAVPDLNRILNGR